jgi:hypothetical protein
MHTGSGSVAELPVLAGRYQVGQRRRAKAGAGRGAHQHAGGGSSAGPPWGWWCCPPPGSGRDATRRCSSSACVTGATSSANTAPTRRLRSVVCASPGEGSPRMLSDSSSSEGFELGARGATRPPVPASGRPLRAGPPAALEIYRVHGAAALRTSSLTWMLSQVGTAGGAGFSEGVDQARWNALHGRSYAQVAVHVAVGHRVHAVVQQGEVVSPSRPACRSGR